MNRIARKTAALALAAAAALFALPAGAATDVTWTATPLTASSTSIRTDGTLKYAYAYGNYTVNGVAFVDEGADGIDNGNCTVNITHGSSTTPSGTTESGDYRNLLGKGWYASAADRTITLRNLEAGKQYLVQIIASRSDYTTQTATAPDRTTTIHFGGSGWEYGGSLTGTFTADSTTEQFSIVYSVQSWLNGLQVRELDGSGGGGGGGDDPSVVDPSIGSASVSVSGATATVSLGGIVLGTDAQGADATSYDVSYSLTNAPAVVALRDQTGTTASFDIANLADGEYTCAVTVATDANKSATTNLAFRIGTPPVTPWTVSPMGPDESSIVTQGTLVYAYAALDQNQPVNGISFRRGASGLAENIDVSPSFSGHLEGMGHVDWTNYGWLLKRALYWNSSVPETVLTFRLKNLVRGHDYLVQIVSFSSRSEEAGMMISVNGTPPRPIGPNGSDTTYRYGASIVGTFTATDATEDVAVTFSGNAIGYRPINAIQVRELPSDEPAGKPAVITVK